MNSSPAARALPIARRLVQPGPVQPVRIEQVQAERGRHFRLVLAPGARLGDAIIRPLHAVGVRSASMAILGGCFGRLHYCVAPPDPTGERVANYTAPIDAGAALLLFGNATLGRSLQGEPIVHCHATFVCADGRVRGGHVVVDRSVVGEEPLTVLATALDGIALRITDDAETGFALMRPFVALPADQAAKEVADAV